jgi:hypothetical protein
MERCDVEESVDRGLVKLIKKDIYLLQKETHEVSVSHRLGCYLQEVFSEFDVDCEYNRDAKAIDNKKRNESGDLVRPDIIVHKRGGSNLLAIEMKKAEKPGDGDIKNLNSYIKKQKYKFGLFIGFRVSSERVIAIKRWFEAHKEPVQSELSINLSG